MRSRLEAYWAAVLDAEGYDWEYEPRAFADTTGQYLPDFRVYIPSSRVGHFYVEVKPTKQAAVDCLDRVAIVWSSEPDVALVVAIGETDDDGGSEMLVGRRGKWTTRRVTKWAY